MANGSDRENRKARRAFLQGAGATALSAMASPNLLTRRWAAIGLFSAPFPASVRMIATPSAPRLKSATTNPYAACRLGSSSRPSPRKIAA